MPGQISPATSSTIATKKGDVIWALDEAGSLVLEAGEHGRTVYRLYHQEFADYLRQELTRAV